MEMESVSFLDFRKKKKDEPVLSFIINEMENNERIFFYHSSSLYWNENRHKGDEYCSMLWILTCQSMAGRSTVDTNQKYSQFYMTDAMQEQRNIEPGNKIAMNQPKQHISDE